ncbi:MAG TPA: tetratricopeptide repeat protein, partial [Methylomirabilota bacterium]|nr:tetratricopeptide repeat protein [Methylomirabilota bacterium]
EAEPLIARSLAIHERALGSEHPYLAYSLCNQADNFFLQGDYTQARFYYEKALDIRERHLGVEDPRTAKSYYKLAQLYYAQGRFEEAETLYEKALNIYECTLRPEHPDILVILEEFVILLRKMKKENRARELEEWIRKIGLRSNQI